MPTDESLTDFEYIVEVKKEARICFGTTIPRRTSPIGKGLSSYQKTQVKELFPKIGPAYYKTELITSALYPINNKIRSKVGTYPLCSKVCRFKETDGCQIPSPGRYSTCKFLTRFDKNGTSSFKSRKFKKDKDNSHPGPGTYNLSKKTCRRTKVMNNFGVPEVLNAVEMFCVNKPVDRCQKCEKLCEGDYWQKDHIIFICQTCWSEEKASHEMFPDKMLKEFKKIRNCSFMHDHQKTEAAIKTLPTKKIKKKIQIENYLSLYL
ncbi:uncharacterized protein [Diabrotica undecimpunctata]|uniref:uncharacterized protein n=1 Tax=Diabrotica undecimpunctata TaxID=50387 RepID=UPI003B63633D